MLRGLRGLQALSALTSALPYSPASLFARAEQGVWFDPSDLTTLFQDSAGTTPVTAAGQPVGKMLDKSGRGNHVVQATAGSRPLYQVDGAGRGYLSFDGVDDSLSTAATIDLSAVTASASFVGLYKASDAAFGSVSGFGPSPGTTPGWEFQVPNAGTTIAFAHRGATANFAAQGTSGAAPRALTVTGTSDLPGGLATLRMNGAALGTAPASTGGGAYGANTLHIGRRGGASLPFNGRVYALITRAGALTAAQIADAEAWVNKRTGAY